jgi:phospholipase/carboxylesterase
MSDPTKTDLAIHTHVFEPGDTGRTLLLLHGTGGDEHDLLPLGRKLAPGAALLSPRGNVLENGMPRFFKRYAEGVFDLEDVAFRATELARWLRAALEQYHIDARKLTVVGYSNGANIAAAAMLLQPDLFPSAILLRSMVTIEPPSARPVPTRVLMLTGEQDAFIPVENAKRLANLLRSRGMTVDQHIFPTGHQLVQADLAISMRWIAGLP